jgi:hypothetical protein
MDGCGYRDVVDNLKTTSTMKKTTKKDTKRKLEINNFNYSVLSEDEKQSLSTKINNMLETMSKYESPYQRFILNSVRKKAHINDLLDK